MNLSIDIIHYWPDREFFNWSKNLQSFLKGIFAVTMRGQSRTQFDTVFFCLRGLLCNFRPLDFCSKNKPGLKFSMWVKKPMLVIKTKVVSFKFLKVSIF